MNYAPKYRWTGSELRGVIDAYCRIRQESSFFVGEVQAPINDEDEMALLETRPQATENDCKVATEWLMEEMVGSERRWDLDDIRAAVDAEKNLIEELKDYVILVQDIRYHADLLQKKMHEANFSSQVYSNVVFSVSHHARDLDLEYQRKIQDLSRKTKTIIRMLPPQEGS